jgi:hypothetical protein
MFKHLVGSAEQLLSPGMDFIRLRPSYQEYCE